MTKKPIDIEKAMLYPSSVFANPEEVVELTDLTTDQKIEILRRWEYDASELAVAEEEGMAGGEPSLLARVLKALDSLSGGYDTEHSPPTKQGGLGSGLIKATKLR
ncbi:hypothetical protein GCM10007972_13290 [Iodidimonas muriae]|uniref:Uncharacterized protein n=1 Tax=Iodidimonas muriae TaxID=261467 RepID=A0ABQ2LD16_9PROT|nr:hypothetical protein [Iodidimonas muriae]GGO10454.1 hypothetical protein GCM10007972_13290 [Iodidimonas muriae]